MNQRIKKALITGGNGNLGRLVAARLLNDGISVIKFDIPGTEPDSTHELEKVITGDIRDTELVESIFTEHKPDAVYHLASLLSGSSEADHLAAWEINATASFHLLQLAVKHSVGTFFFAGTNASYGGILEDPLPENAEQWPENIYGATKVAVERLGVFYKLKSQLDFRILRFPMVLSPFAPPTAVTAYPSHAFKAAINAKPFVFPVSAQIGMSTMFLEDVINSIIAFTYAPKENVKQHAYNLHGYYFSCQDLASALQARYPDFSYSFEPTAVVEQLITRWPNEIIDAAARADWGWEPRYNFESSVEKMLEMVAG